ncbi:MAG: hypothetical protein K2J00_03520 [Bacteroidaceae bacterium]|nr:hypothetical protein [Bacteroidaceae bacterium]
MTEKETYGLLTRFLNGETTLAEERELARALKSWHCPAEQEERRTVLLSMLPEDTETPLPEGFCRRLYEKTDTVQDGQRQVKRAMHFKPWYGIGGITAAAAVSACLWLPLPTARQTEKENAIQGENLSTYAVPSLEEAMQQDTRHRNAMEKEITEMLTKL